MLKIAVLGSCISRDIMTRKLVPYYKDFCRCINQQNQISMISLLGSRIPYNYDEINNLKAFDKRHLTSELNKSIWDSLIINKPDYILMDFYGDIYYGALEVENSFITNKKWLFRRADGFKKMKTGKSYDPFKNFEEFFILWKEGLSTLVRFLEKNLPDCRVIINSTRFEDELIDQETGEILLVSKLGKHREIDVNEYNKMWNKLDNYAIETYGFLKYDFKGEKYYVSDEHPSGFFYVHFQKEYYINGFRKLMSTIHDDLKSRAKKNISIKGFVNKYSSSIEDFIFNKEGNKNNLIYNSDFKDKRAFWSCWNNDFKIENSIVMVDRKDIKNRKDSYILSNPIEGNFEDDKILNYSCEIKVGKEIGGEEELVIFMTFAQDAEFMREKSKWNNTIKLNDIQGYEKNKWIKIEGNVKPKEGRFLKAGFIINGNGKVSYKNFKLTLQ